MKFNFKYIIFIVIFFSFVYYIETHKKQRRDRMYDDYKKTSFSGIVIKKFIDSKEHSFPYVYIQNYKTNQLEKLNLFYDISNTYDAIGLKDTVIKFKDDPWIYKYVSNKLVKLTLVEYR